jgi:hypothetical protein
LWDLISKRILASLIISQINPSEVRIFFKPGLLIRRKCGEINSRRPGIKSRSDRYPGKEVAVVVTTNDFSCEGFLKEFNISARKCAL